MAIYLAEVTLEKMLPPRGASTYSSGLEDRNKAEFIYGPKSSNEPTLIIVDPICDDDGNVILSGYYELKLSADRTILILSQSQKVVATIPVFKIEEDKSQTEQQPMNKKSQRKFDKEQKKQAKKNKKLIKQGKIPSEPQIYNNATIEYDVKGDYYLIKYECGKIRAWGAVKF